MQKADNLEPFMKKQMTKNMIKVVQVVEISSVFKILSQRKLWDHY